MISNMHQIWRLAINTALAAAAIGVATPALAGDVTLDFDELGVGFLGAGDQFNHKGLQLTAYSGLPDGQPGDLVGAIFDGNDPSMCQRLLCPVNNYTPGYYAGLNDGVLVIDSGQTTGMHIKSFDASFIGAFERQGDVTYPDVAGLLEVRGFTADGSYVTERFNLNGLGVVGSNFYMDHYETSAGFASHAFTEVAIFAYSCNFSGECAAFENNAGQFALDNVNMAITAVPEPTSWMMLLGGLGTIAVARRRRSLQSASGK
jgi:hypothetical protein